MKKTVLYIIDSLAAIGGAEVMMISPLKEIHHKYNIIVVTLYPGNVFEKNNFTGDKQYCLHMTSRTEVFSAAKKLRKIIKENEVTFVHSFLYWSIVVARLAVTKKTNHIFSLASMVTEHIYQHKWYSGYTQLIDKITYNKRQVVISPTEEVLKDFDSSIGIKGKAKVLYNFVLDDFFTNQIEYQQHDDQLRFVAVGNIKEVKNYQVIIDAFQLLSHLPISLDIYGFGNLSEHQQEKISANNLDIKQMGCNHKIDEILSQYDAFIMSSFLEGFGISAAEAMAKGLPLLLSDIATLKEVSQGNALFFNPYNAQSLADLIDSIFNKQEDLKKLSEKGKLIAKAKYTKQKYVSELLELYQDLC